MVRQTAHSGVELTELCRLHAVRHRRENRRNGDCRHRDADRLEALARTADAGCLSDPRGAPLHHHHHACRASTSRRPPSRRVAGRLQFPSGHTAAAVASSAIVVVIFWHTRRRWIRALAVMLAAVIPVCVAMSRLYRGMHFFTDVIFGALLGGASVIATTIVLRRAADRQGQEIGVIERDSAIDDLVNA
ncbi:MAG: phosphatase PAP2 family protein [Ilumatobacteraceae bacterium]